MVRDTMLRLTGNSDAHPAAIILISANLLEVLDNFSQVLFLMKNFFKKLLIIFFTKFSCEKIYFSVSKERSYRVKNQIVQTGLYTITLGSRSI